MPPPNGPHAGRGGRRPRPRRPQRGNKNLLMTRDDSPFEASFAAPSPASGVATPPLTEAISSDAMKFEELALMNLLDPLLLQTITQNLGFERMTPVQQATLPVLLQSRADCLGQAKTGTGKTIAFLLPAIQTMMRRPRSTVKRISLLVISPTRELAMQIAKEASSLLARMPQYKVCLAIGGTNKDREEREILGKCDILVATPGRLNDHLTDARIVAMFSELNTLVLDEADRLLDMGFMPALKDIISCLPDKQQTNRQGMLFSATVGPHVEKFAHIALSPGYEFISTIPAGELNTHERVSQLLITVPNFLLVLPATLAAIRAEMASGGPNFKAIVFAPTAALADWYAFTLAQVPNLPPVSVLHSRISQSKRTSVTNTFRDSIASILVATDVVARGMDFPNVTTVIQVGVPADRESYIHRLGRTARAGREGRGLFIIAEAESFFPRTKLKEIDFVPTAPAITIEDEAIVQEAAAKADIQGKVYQAWLGYYKNHLKGLDWTPERLVAEGNRYAIDALCAGGVPEIQKSTVGKMGLKGVKGLNVVPNLSHRGQGDGGGHGREGGRGRGGGGRGRGRGR